MINIGSRRECFFDDFLINQEKTTAEIVLHNPIPREIVKIFDDRWETNGCAYFNFFYDEWENKYRMYYLSREKADVTAGNTHGEQNRISYAESDDGIHWDKPNVGICEFQGSKENNIILDINTAPYYDNFFVFADKNPDCPKEERYKAVSDYHHCLYAYVSGDGINFKLSHMITDKGSFDSLNTAFWDEEKKIYRCFFRGFHLPGDFEGKDEFDKYPLKVDSEERNKRIRDIRYIESKDFKSWSEQKLVKYSGDDYPSYTNGISPYFRAPHMLVGFPTRYIERKCWSKSFDEVLGVEKRKERMKQHIRYALSVTDCAFMCSRDGEHFKRYDEAFFRPGVESGENWNYGGCYPAVGFVLTESESGGVDREISMYCPEGGWGDIRNLRRFTIRQDGFCSLHANAKEKYMETKPFIFKGNSLFANISTSAAGYVYFEICDMDGNSIESPEMFGDSVDKLIGFDEELSAFSGKEVILKMRMSDCDVYSIKFEER